jgi:radical SAM protein with 4Fe4S-binding SPASM domain
MDGTFLKPKSFHLQWHITDKCNFRCRHCYIKNPKRELGTQQLLMILKNYTDLIRVWALNKNNKTRDLSLTGGEPLLRRDFFKILEHVHKNREMFTSVNVMSNGSTIDDKVAKKLKAFEVSAVQISMEGLEETNDKIRGRGSFIKSIEGIRNLLDNDVHVGISMTVHKENVSDVEKMFDFCKNLGVASFGVSRLVYIEKDDALKMLEPLETKNFYETIMNIKRKWDGRGIHIGTHCSDSLWFIEDAHHATHGCSAGYDSFSVMPNGDVVPCRRLPIKVGNAMKKSFFDIWYTSKVLWKIRNMNMANATCKKCEIFEKCRGGAKCVANSYFGSPFAPDPQCWKIFSNLAQNSKFAPGSGKLKLVNSYVEAFALSGNPQNKKYFKNMK